MATQTAVDLRNKALDLQKQKNESFDRCDTDGFLTQWALGLEAEELNAQANVEENGGKAEFPALFDLTGKRVRAKLITTHPPWARWANVRTWAFCDKEDKFTGLFINAFPKRPETMARKGYKEGFEKAPAKATTLGHGHGLGGTVWVATIRTDKGYPENAKVVK